MGIFQVANGDVVGSDHMNQAISQSVPRFATTAERDAAYAAFPGGPQVGMQCWVAGPSSQQWTYSGGRWEITAGQFPRAYAHWGPNNAYSGGWGRVAYAPSIASAEHGIGTFDGTGLLTFAHEGLYDIHMFTYFSVVGTEAGIASGDDLNHSPSFMGDYGTVASNTPKTVSTSYQAAGSVGSKLGLWTYNTGGGTIQSAEMVVVYCTFI